ncbi:MULTISPECIES: NAD(P)H-dependent glycerol-3-phosphate dehydrogenase [unclassified Oceanobacter]|uniref:NAD(P)H-dependent glycerol-3-phosphate dehydrogenase n=2 Tax=Gammaproteobacteria TaxID=1236 RepID=UPI0026E2CF3E|nr:MULTISPECIES: NAD(P)H-dependent glycerol-3-phosphate dehydrogenase [unclassified Oceanobacter]MDO6681121.1 NAD(P)H-dependent glycerol-3-phosphate dehydrogenase [Oceanobacter sp. 5_MG-2023]MDP2504307.1 NAD(P)H-dependent glycerol-3-phosphate dehydrogenase [Oceanobacter sp. 3_MG-2023]MDP2546745.1 NAD(P)H-dependent glycerol-3-phosphate dehydrogenase [Oceanobacter sp. 4_MG-2023]MDP2608515.1 NAD(P)H-dependent glycerol-3-phosphate dehydrogenase [Oceanobacter sp. 1_MG-2023]MDP2611723.1 NAD(P)H-depe
MGIRTAAIIGGGSFGTVTANILADNNIQAIQWLRNPEIAESINQLHVNEQYLPGIALNSSLRATTTIEEAVVGADVIFVSVPSKSVREVISGFAHLIKPEQGLVSTTKGIEPDGFLLMSQVIRDVFPDNPVGVLSGPNLAKEIARKELAGTVIASENSDLRRDIQEALSCNYFRVYASNDVYGVELGGALKNIYAIVSGFVAALGMGENTKSMIITRSLAEMSRFADAMGANPLTFLGLAGVGDLVVTCMSPLSRNFRVGYAIGQGKTLDQATEELGEVAEGVNTLRYVRAKAEDSGIYMPLVMGAYECLFNGADPGMVARELMTGEHASDVEFALPRHEI